MDRKLLRKPNTDGAISEERNALIGKKNRGKNKMKSNRIKVGRNNESINKQVETF